MAAPNATVVLSGGAPNGTLTAGALCGIYESGKTFNTFYTSGAGAVFGLVNVGGVKPPDAALRDTVNAGIDDTIYQYFPLGYKTFYKSGPFTVPFMKFASNFKLPEPPGRGDDLRRFYNDMVDLWTVALTPTFISPNSQALCAPYPFVDEFVDFEKVKAFKGRIYANSYCIETARMHEFGKHQLNAAHFHAALAFPFIYPPAQIGQHFYYEGSAFDPLNLPGLWERVNSGEIPNERHTIVLIDILGAFEKALIRRPRNLLDAYGISILAPVVALARAKRELFELETGVKLLTLSFDIDPTLYPTMTDWSFSNLSQMFEIGRKAGKEFVEQHGNKLPDREPDSADPVERTPRRRGSHRSADEDEADPEGN
jgi:NTE family protein